MKRFRGDRGLCLLRAALVASFGASTVGCGNDAVDQTASEILRDQRGNGEINDGRTVAGVELPRYSGVGSIWRITPTRQFLHTGTDILISSNRLLTAAHVVAEPLDGSTLAVLFTDDGAVRQLLASDSEVFAATRDGALDLAGLFSSSVRAKLTAPDSVVLAATEPAAWIQEGLPSLAIVASDVSDVRALLYETDAGYVDPRDNGDVIPLRTTPAAPVVTSARSEHALVLSARGSTQGLWLVGGRDSLGRWSHEVRRFDPETRTWTTLPPDRRVPLRRVEAAVIRPWDGMLYAIERPSSRGRSTLVRINTTTGERTIAQRWHDHIGEGFDTYRMANTPDGRLAIVASNARGRWVLVELELDDEERSAHDRRGGSRSSLTVRRWQTGSGSLVSGMVADEQGLSFAIDRGGPTAEVAGVRYEHLRRAGCWEDLH